MPRSLFLIIEKSWGGPLLMSAFSRRCTICGSGRRTKRSHLEIYEREARSWRACKRPLCARCRPRLALASLHGGVLNAPNGMLLIDAVAASKPHPGTAEDV